MTIEGRWAGSDDGPALATFTCGGTGGGPARDVQEWVRDDLLDWADESETRRLRVYYEGSTLVAVVAFRDDVEDHPESGYFIYLMAVADSHKRQGVGKRIVVGLLATLSQERPGASVTWMVDASNSASIALCESIDCTEPLSPPEHPGMLEYSIQLVG